MAITAVVTRNKTFVDDDTVDVAGLHAGFTPLVTLIGQASTAQLASNSVTSDQIASSAVGNTELADDAVTLTKLSSGTPGGLIVFDSSGDPVDLGAGTASHILTSNGIGATPSWQAPAAVGTISISSIVPGGNNTKLITNGSGTVEWSSDASNSQSYAMLAEVQSSGTAGGTPTAAAWTTRVLNTTLVDTDGIISSLSANEFTLSSGTYRINAKSPGFACNSHNVRLYDVTNAAVVHYKGGSTDIVGQTGFSGSGTDGGQSNNNAVLTGEFELTGTTALRIEYYMQTAAATNGLGRPASIVGHSEMYSVVELWKIA